MIEMLKSYRRTDKQTTDNWREEKLTWDFNSGEQEIEIFKFVLGGGWGGDKTLAALETSEDM